MANFKDAAEVRAQATTVAEEVERYFARWRYYCEQLSTIPNADMLAAGMTQGEIDQIVSGKTKLAAQLATYYANAADERTFILRQARLTVF